MKLLYLANIRLPTEKAHGLQIMQMGEAFAHTGAQVTLIVAARRNITAMKQIKAIWEYYGVAQIFTVERGLSLDLLGLVPRLDAVAFMIQSLTYTIFLALALLFRRADVYYSRDLATICFLCLFKPRRLVCYEAHQISKSRLGSLVQGWCARRAGTVIAVTATLGDDLKKRGARSVLTAHDGFRVERFANLPDRKAARATLGLPTEAFIVGYTGRLHTLSLSKGIDTLIDAIATLQARAIFVCLVGGPPEIANELQARWTKYGLLADRFLYRGHVSPPMVPLFMAAFDVCAMPSPKADFFAYYSSPLKLFEYMAAGGTILATGLPAVAEVLRNGDNAFLVTPGDTAAVADALACLQDDRALRERLGAAAKRDSVKYSWQARAERILQAIQETN